MLTAHIQNNTNEYILLQRALKTKRDLKKFIAKPKLFMHQNGIEIPDNMGVEIVHAQENIIYFVIPLARNRELDHEMHFINAATTKITTRGTLGCVFSFATISTEALIGAVPSSVSTLSSVSTASTAGTA